jgi:hypothetical protein
MLFKSFKILSVPRGTLKRYMKDRACSREELVKVNLERISGLPSEHVNKLVELLHNHGPKILWTELSGHKTHGFSVGNKKRFETTI